MGERNRKGLCPLDPRAASGWPSAKVGGALSRINWRVSSIPPGAAPRAQCLCPRVSGAVPKVHSWRHVRFCMARSAHGEAENCAATPRTCAERANARNGRCFPPCVPGEPSSFICWERPQPELSLQLVYPWGAAVVCGLWQGTPGGFSRGLAEVPLSALLPPTSWARKKSARLPGRDPAIPAAEGGTSEAPRRGAKKAFRLPGGTSNKKPRREQRGKSKTTAGAGPG